MLVCINVISIQVSSLNEINESFIFLSSLLYLHFCVSLQDFFLWVIVVYHKEDGMILTFNEDVLVEVALRYGTPVIAIPILKA